VIGGFGDVAWKNTPVNADDPDSENTIRSLPSELFQAVFEEKDENEKITRTKAPEPFGSDRFWVWFEDLDK